MKFQRHGSLYIPAHERRFALLPTLGNTQTVPGKAGGGGQTPTQVVITTQPSGAVDGVALTGQPVVEIRDANNILCSGSTAAVTVSVATGTPTLDASSTLTVNAVAGVATFTNLMLDGPGSVKLTFASSGLTSATSSSFTVSSGGLWNGHLPGGLSKLFDGPWSGSLPGVGSSGTAGVSPWSVFQRTSKTNFVTDNTAPRNTNVLEFDYSGVSGGNAPGTIYSTFSAKKHVYFATYFKYSSNYVPNGTSINKWLFMQPNSGDCTCLMYGTSAPFQLRNANEFSSDSSVQQSNTGSFANPSLALNTWYLLEWRVKYATTSSSGDGLMDLWINGTRTVWNTALQTQNDSGFTQVEFSPTWGGSNGPTPAGTIHFDSASLYAA